MSERAKEQAEKREKPSAAHEQQNVYLVVSYCVSIVTVLLCSKNCCHGNKLNAMLMCQTGFILGWHYFQVLHVCLCVQMRVGVKVHVCVWVCVEKSRMGGLWEKKTSCCFNQDKKQNLKSERCETEKPDDDGILKPGGVGVGGMT